MLLIGTALMVSSVPFVLLPEITMMCGDRFTDNHVSFPTQVDRFREPLVPALYPPLYGAGSGATCPIWDSQVGHFRWQEQEGRPTPEQRSAAAEQAETMWRRL